MSKVRLKDKFSTNDTIDRNVVDPGRDDFEYYVSLTINDATHEIIILIDAVLQVKWQGRAHYHATWERNAKLASCRGTRRLDNYFRKVVQEDIHMQNDEDVPPEDREKWSLDRERDADALQDYRKVERVIDTQEIDGGETQYYVKCTLFTSHVQPFSNSL